MTSYAFASALGRLAGTAYFAPAFFKEDRVAVVVYNAVDMAICGISSSMMKKKGLGERNTWQEVVSIVECLAWRVVGGLTAIIITKVIFDCKISLGAAFNISASSINGIYLMSIVNKYLLGKKGMVDAIW